MSKQDEHDLLGELEGIVNGAFSGIKDEWQELQIRLMQQSRQMTDEFLESNEQVKAMLCVGTIISKEQFDSDDGVEVVGPNGAEYIGIGSGSPVHARMQPAVGVASAGDMYRFLTEKHLVCSLYEATDYVSLLMHAKYKNSTLVAMSSPNGIAVSLERKDEPDYVFYLMFDEEVESKIKHHLGVLSSKQRDLLMHLCEAQVVAPKMKKTQPKIWAMMIEAIKEYQPNEFLDPTEGDE